MGGESRLQPVTFDPTSCIDSTAEAIYQSGGSHQRGWWRTHSRLSHGETIGVAVDGAIGVESRLQSAVAFGPKFVPLNPIVPPSAHTENHM